MALGGVEIGLAMAVLFQVTPAFLVGISLWKLSTEMLFALSGAPFWEVIERGGSYVAPLLLAVVILVNPSTRTNHAAKAETSGDGNK